MTETEQLTTFLRELPPKLTSENLKDFVLLHYEAKRSMTIELTVLAFSTRWKSIAMYRCPMI